MSCAAREPLRSTPLRAAATIDLERADHLAVLLVDFEDADLGAHGGDDVEQDGAGGVEAERVEDKVRVGEQQSGAEEECGRAHVAGDGRVDRVERLAAGDAEAASRG